MREIDISIIPLSVIEPNDIPPGIFNGPVCIGKFRPREEVVAVEPPVFGLEDGLGVRLIDNVLVTETGCERLTSTTRDLIIV